MMSIDYIPINRWQRDVETVPEAPFPLPEEGVSFTLDNAVIDALPEHGSKLLKAVRYAHSIGSLTAKLKVRLPNGTKASYFLKTFSGFDSESKCIGEYAALEAAHQATPGFAPKPYAWGKMSEGDGSEYFLLQDFIELRSQPADAFALGSRLAEMHQHSQSPSGEFGFHVRSWHGSVEQDVGQYNSSWTTVFRRHISHFMDLASKSPALTVDDLSFKMVCNLVLEFVVPRLLDPLQEDGRYLKPSLVHGDCWDGNTGVDSGTNAARIFDMCSFYGHNEYDTGNWRAPRHKVSNRDYIDSYQKHIPPSEPVEDWPARQLLYSLVFNMGNVINIPNSLQGPVVYEDMLTLCKMFCPRQIHEHLADCREHDSVQKEGAAADEDNG